MLEAVNRWLGDTYFMRFQSASAQLKNWRHHAAMMGIKKALHDLNAFFTSNYRTRCAYLESAPKAAAKFLPVDDINSSIQHGHSALK